MSKEETVIDLCRPLVESLGMQLIGVQYHHHSSNALLRIYLDKEGGIGMDDIVFATEQLNPLLDVHDPIGAPYTLEVSSPGLDRPLFSLEDFIKFTNSIVKVVLRVPVDGKRRFEALIKEVADEEITFFIDEGKNSRELKIEYRNIEKARIVPQFD